MRFLASLCLSLAAIVGRAAAGPAEAYYINDFERHLGVEKWVTVTQYDLHALSLVDENPYGGQRCAKIDYTVTKKGHRSYFKIPLDVEIDPEASYVVDAYVRLDAPAHVNVTLGIVWDLAHGDATMSNGCYPITPPVETRGQWVRLLSRELRPALASNIGCFGFSPLSRQNLTGLYVSVLAQLEPGDRVTVYLDDVRLTPATDGIRVAWAEDDARARKELDYGKSPETDIEKSFVWGVTGSLEGLSKWLQVPPEVCAAVIARDWQENFFDSCAALGGLIRQGRALEEQEARLQRLLDVTAGHGFRMQTSVDLTGYSKASAYDPHADRSQSDALIRRVITRFRDHPALLAWYILDEPRAEWPALRDHWVWGKRRIEALDQHHPVTAALNNPRSVRFYAPWSAITQIDRYPFTLAAKDNTGMARNGALSQGAVCKTAWQGGARTVWFVPQAYADLRKRRMPTPAEVRLQVYVTLAHGTTGIFLYHYQSRPLWHLAGGQRDIVDVVLARPSAMGREVRELGRVIPVVAPVLLGTRWVEDGGVSTDAPMLTDFGIPCIQAQLNRGADHDVLVVYNLDVDARQKGTVRLPAGLVGERALHDLHARQAVPLATGSSFDVDLAPGDGRFYALATPGVAQQLYTDIDQRHYAKLKCLFAAELAEARAVGVTTAPIEQSLVESDKRIEAGECAEAVDRLSRARQALAGALTANRRYKSCRDGIDVLQKTISEANAAFEDYLVGVPWEGNQLEYSQPRRIAAALYKPHGDLILAAARCWYRLRYGLMNGKVGECEDALRACQQLAQTTRDLVDVLVSGKKHETSGMWQIYHPLTPRVRELMERCDDLTLGLEDDG